MQSIYLDNAATSFPKPAGVSDSMKRYLDCVGATINRSVYGRIAMKIDPELLSDLASLVDRSVEIGRASCRERV